MATSSSGTRPALSDGPGSLRRSLLLYAALLAAAIPASLLTLGPLTAGIWTDLPQATVDLGYSFARMVAAYALSLGFSLAYGYYAATRRTGERVMIPVLDILQSVPILGFFPVAIVVFIQLFGPSSWIGPNLASVFLIFTSMAWNMVFGVYESLKSIPSDLREAADSFGSTGRQRMRRLVLPATVHRLVYNSILSWTGGWFFLVEAEIFTTGSQPLAGIGSYLSFAASDGNASAFVAGIVVLILLIVAMDVLVWRPLSRIADRYRYDQTPSGEVDAGSSGPAGTRMRRAASYLTRGVRVGVSRLSVPFVQLASYTVRPRRRERRISPRAALGTVALGAVLVLVWLILIAIGVAVYDVYAVPIAPSVAQQMLSLPLAMGASVLRVAAAFAISLAIALPLALFLTRPSRAASAGLPTIQIIASIPATAFFPVIIFELVPYLSAEGAAILMLITGMIWYLFFNLLSGLRSVPPDLQEAARSFGMRGRSLLSRVLLPGSFAAFVTGAITAFGGGWNTLIVAEYLNLAPGQTFQVFGIGALLDIGYAEPNGLPLMVGALFTLVATVILINELLWKPLYRRATTRYRYD
ncbi:MAG: ABC transporter permease subunit [Thermoplasmata archaeon]